LMQEGKSFLEEARSRYWLALLYSKQGAIPQAQAELLAARDVFTHFGAAADLAETMKLLEQLERSISP